MNRGIGWSLLLLLAAMLAPLALWPAADLHAIDLLQRHAPPSAEHWLGTDQLGRDLFLRLAAGGWNALLATAISAAVAFILGTLLGLGAAFAAPALRFTLLRLADLGLVLPPIVIALLVVAVAGFSPVTVGLALGLGGVGTYALLTEALAQGVLRQPYVQAAELLGAGRAAIAWRHLLPAVLPQALTYFAAEAGHAVIHYSALAFLGLGADTGQPDWGVMLFEYRYFLFEHPGLVLWPGAAICLLVTAMHLAFEPKETAP